MPHHILIADDDPFQRRLIRELLSMVDGLSMTEAENGNQVIEMVRLTPPDLILMDVMMPGLDGIQVCQQLKRDPRLRSIAIIVFSALQELCDNAVKAGADGYMLKPAEAREILRTVRQMLSARSSES